MSQAIDKVIVGHETGKGLTANLRQAKNYADGANKMLDALKNKASESNVDIKKSLTNVEDYLDEASQYLDKSKKNLSNGNKDSSKNWIEKARDYIVDAQNTQGETLKNIIEKMQEALKEATKSIDNKSSKLESADDASKALADSLTNKIIWPLADVKINPKTRIPGNLGYISATGTNDVKSKSKKTIDESSTTDAISEKLNEHGITDGEIILDKDGNTYIVIPIEYSTNEKGEKLPKGGTMTTTMKIRVHNISDSSEAYIVHIGGQGDNFKQDKNVTSGGTTASGRLAFGCEDNDVGIVEVMFVDEKGKYGTTGVPMMADKDARKKERETMISIGETLNDTNPDVPCIESGHSTGSQVKMMETFVAKDQDGNLDKEELNQVIELYNTYDMLMPQDTNHDAINRVTGGQVQGKKSNFPENVPGEFVLDSEKLTYAYGSDGLVSTAVTPKKDKSTQKKSDGYFTIYSKLLTENDNVVDIKKEEVKNDNNRVLETKLYTENENGEKTYIEVKSIEMKETSHTYTAINSNFGDGAGKQGKNPLTYSGDKGLLYTYLKDDEQNMKKDKLSINLRDRSNIQ